MKLLNKNSTNKNSPATYALSFNKAQIPEYIVIMYTKYKVKPYYPLPIRCYRCQKYGHGLPCKRAPVCPKCAITHDGNHKEEECTGPEKCAACGGNHTVRHSGCPKFIFETRVTRYAQDYQTTYTDARKAIMKEKSLINDKNQILTTVTNKFIPSNPNYPKSYASVLDQTKRREVSAPQLPHPQPGYESIGTETGISTPPPTRSYSNNNSSLVPQGNCYSQTTGCSSCNKMQDLVTSLTTRIDQLTMTISNLVKLIEPVLLRSCQMAVNSPDKPHQGIVHETPNITSQNQQSYVTDLEVDSCPLVTNTSFQTERDRNKTPASEPKNNKAKPEGRLDNNKLKNSPPDKQNNSENKYIYTPHKGMEVDNITDTIPSTQNKIKHG